MTYNPLRNISRKKGASIPDGWVVRPLCEVAQIKTGLAKGKVGHKDAIELPYLRVANVQDGRIDLTEVKTIPVERNHIDRYRLHRGDVLMTEGGDFDKLGRGDVWQGQIEPCLHQNHVFAVRPKSALLDSYFLANQAASHHGRKYFLSCAKRSTNLASINSSQLKQFPVLLPRLAEQRAISQVLSVWDNAIKVTEVLISNGKLHKRMLMQELLTGRKRLPGFSGAFQRKRIGELALIDRESLSSQTPNDFEFQYISLSEVNAGEIKGKLPTIQFGSSPSRARRKLRRGDILMATVRPNLQAFGYVDERFDGCVASTGFAVLSAKPQHSGRYLFHYLFGQHITAQIEALIVGSSYPAINSSDVGNLSVLCPEYEEQIAIGTILDAAEASITHLCALHRMYSREKLALTQLLLTGKRRVKLDPAA